MEWIREPQTGDLEGADTGSVKVEMYRYDVPGTLRDLVSDLDWAYDDDSVIEYADLLRYIPVPITRVEDVLTAIDRGDVEDTLALRVAWAQAAADYHGAENLDDYPVEMPLADLAIRWDVSL